MRLYIKKTNCKTNKWLKAGASAPAFLLLQQLRRQLQTTTRHFWHFSAPWGVFLLLCDKLHTLGAIRQILGRFFNPF